MKSGNKSSNTEASFEINQTIVVQANSKKQTPVLITILPVLSMIAAIVPGVVNKTSGIEIARVAILALILTAAATFYIRWNADSILNKALSKTMITVFYLGSILLLLFVPGPETFSFWMIGGLVIAMLIDSKLGLLFHFNLCFILGITFSLQPETIIQIMIIGAMMSLLAGALKDRATVIYATIIILSTNITLSFAINNFFFETKSNYNYLNSLFSILAVLASAFFICIIYDKIVESDSAVNSEGNSLNNSSVTLSAQAINFSNITETTEQAATSSSAMEQSLDAIALKSEVSGSFGDSDLSAHLNTRTSYDILCDMDNELINKMKQYSESLYSHALHIGDLSYRAAKEIGANDLLAKAGGLYHEVGKINGKNYIEEGLIIADEYAFPKELKAILKEHNIKYEKPSSVEAAIVMLSDNVVSTIEYIEKTEDHKFTTNKIIDNIFQMRMDKGTFDSANLSLKDFKKLKEFYQKEFNS